MNVQLYVLCVTTLLFNNTVIFYDSYQLNYIPDL